MNPPAPPKKARRELTSKKRCKIPAQHKDLNDWPLAGATANDLVAEMANAEVLHEAEQSWTDALNAAVVTSSELHGLKLRPRRKLLADWFCEGDLGFIFAFRGIGKTWLALGIASALSTGGNLGEWQARQSVKVFESRDSFRSHRKGAEHCQSGSPTSDNAALYRDRRKGVNSGQSLNACQRHERERSRLMGAGQ
jgi:hypothetical protein